jgi:hypothetical protein
VTDLVRVARERVLSRAPSPRARGGRPRPRRRVPGTAVFHAATQTTTGAAGPSTPAALPRAGRSALS